MQYSLKKITTVEQCDTLLTKAEKKKRNLERRKRNLGESLDTFRARLERMNEEALVVTVSIDAFTRAYHALPEGKYKADMLVKIKRMEVRQASVDLKRLTCNVATLLVKEMKYNTLDSQAAALAEHIAAVKYLRMTIGKRALRISRKSASTPVTEEQRTLDQVPQAYSDLTTSPLSMAASHSSGVKLPNGIVYTPFEYRSPMRAVTTG